MANLRLILLWMNLNYEEAYWDSVEQSERWLNILLELTDERD